MKSRVFIGSSVEGLGIAYAIQQNLLHNAETTVWDQGVFELSSTTIESLTKVLSTSDFGIFVFSPDDILKIRSKESPTVRDNVLFEMGLFIGRLGRDRVFFIVPEASDFHIATDLLGITPGKYDANRSDGSMQAATGPVSHQIRLQIKSLGSLTTDNTEPNEPTKTEDSNNKSPDWIDDFVSGKYDDAIIKLNDLVINGIKSEVFTAPLVAYCELKKDQSIGISRLFEISKKFINNQNVHILAASFLRNENLIEKALELLNELPAHIKESPGIRIAIAECHASNHEETLAIDLLRNSEPHINSDVAICLSKLHEEKEEKDAAFKTLVFAYQNNSKNEELRYRLAKLAIDENQYEIALYLLDELTIGSNNSDYWGYLGNCLISLNLFDQAMQAYKHAENNARDIDKPWIINNIGNLYFNKGLPSEAILQLNRSIKMANNSDYAHDRLSRSLKSKAEEDKSRSKKKKEGLQKLREMYKENPLNNI